MKRFLLLAAAWLLCLPGLAQTLEAPSWAPDPSIPFQATRPTPFKLHHTKLAVSFDWQKQHVLGKAELTISPWFYAQDSVHLDAVGMEVHALELIDGENRTALPHTNDGQQLHIALPATLERDQTVVLAIDYTAKPMDAPTKGGTVAGDKGLFFIDADESDPNKPTQLWTQGEVQANSRWFPTFDQPNIRCTQELTVTIREDFETLSNGTLVSSTNNGDGTRTDYWKQDQPHAPYLFALIAGDFAVVKDTWRGKEVGYYVEPAYAPYARGIFPHTPEMLEFFSNRLGVEYPWDKYSQVIVRDFVAGAMENTTAVTYTENYQKTDRELLDGSGELTVAHELFHHWFGDLVTCESWSNLPLNESFANYSEYLWMEYKYGLAAADRHYDQERAGYLNESQSKREPLIRYRVADPNNMFDAHSYNKGGRVLHMLRKLLGDEAFFAGLKLYLERNKYTAVEIAELRIAMEDVSGQDLMWFFDQWFMQPGHVELEVAYELNKTGLELTVKQVQDTRYQPVYRLPLRVHVRADGNDFFFPITVTQAEETFSFAWGEDLPTAPSFIDLDPEHYLLGTLTESGKSLDHYLAQYAEGAFYLQRLRAQGKLAEALEKGELSESQIVTLAGILQKHLEADFWGDRFETFAFLNPHFDKLIAAKGVDGQVLQTAIVARITGDDKSNVRRVAVEHFQKNAALKKAQKPYRKAVAAAAADSSYAVAGAALIALADIDPKTAQAQAETELADPNGKMKGAAAATLLAIGTEDAAAKTYAYVEEAKGSNGLIGDLFDIFLPQLESKDPKKKEAAKQYLMKLAKNEELSLYHRAAGVLILMDALGEEEEIKEFVRERRDNEKHPGLKGFYQNQYGDL